MSNTSVPPSADSTRPSITLFAIPKPFVGHIGMIQRNALRSWLALSPRPQIILCGDDAGVAEVAAEFGVEHLGDIARNEQGTPLLNDAFQRTRAAARHDLIAYLNGDIILGNSFLSALGILVVHCQSDFLMIGRRTDVNVVAPIDTALTNWLEELDDLATREGRLAPQVCKDYFVFRRSQYDDIPAFAVGRANWDNWMVHRAHELGIPVIDATSVTRVYHQNHDYSHLNGGKTQAYLAGSEAKQNQALGGGRHLVTGSAANWKLTPAGLVRTRAPHKLVPFLADLPNFARLLLELLGMKRTDFEQGQRNTADVN